MLTFFFHGEVPLGYYFLQDGFERAEEDDLEGVVVKPLQQPYQFGYPKKGDLGWMKWKRDFGESWEVDAVRAAAFLT